MGCLSRHWNFSMKNWINPLVVPKSVRSIHVQSQLNVSIISCALGEVNWYSPAVPCFRLGVHHELRRSSTSVRCTVQPAQASPSPSPHEPPPHKPVDYTTALSDIVNFFWQTDQDFSGIIAEMYKIVKSRVSNWYHLKQKQNKRT